MPKAPSFQKGQSRDWGPLDQVPLGGRIYILAVMLAFFRNLLPPQGQQRPDPALQRERCRGHMGWGVTSVSDQKKRLVGGKTDFFVAPHLVGALAVYGFIVILSLGTR